MMQFEKNKASSFISGLIFAVVGVLVGLLLILIPVDLLLNIVSIIMGVVTIVCNIPSLIRGIGNIHKRGGVFTLIVSGISILLGLMMIFYSSEVLLIAVGIYMVLLPVLNILLAKEHFAQFKAELPKLIIGAVLILLGPATTLDVLFDVAGWIVLVLSVLYAVLLIVTKTMRLKRSQNTTGSRVFVDTDGNGTIDTVYVDTDGNGKPDTATRYKGKK